MAQVGTDSNKGSKQKNAFACRGKNRICNRGQKRQHNKRVRKKIVKLLIQLYISSSIY